MKIKWLSEARNELRELVQYYRAQVGRPYAKKFADRVLGEVAKLADFPEMGVLKYDTLMGKYGFRALFIGNYVCVYKIDGDTVYIFRIADARGNYIYHIFGVE